MSFCEQCGSSSRDHDGFCGGCGAPWPVAGNATQTEAAGALKPAAQSTPGRSALYLPPMDVDPLVDESIWVHLARILLLGPRAMTFGDLFRALVAGGAAILLYFYVGEWAAYLVLPAWVIWVVWAARD